jgi:hypothetical protein
MPLLLASLLLAAGCGSGRPKCIAVSGIVTYRGKPVETAIVTFFPKNTRPATGWTDAQGRFTLRTFSTGDGVVLGDHIVCVTKKIVDAKTKKNDPYPKATSVLPDRYGTPVTSPLKATVTADGPNDFRFDLTD